MKQHAANTGSSNSTIGLFSLLMLAIFDMELAVMEMLSPLFSHLDRFSKNLADAAMLSLLFAAPLWFFLIKPLTEDTQRDHAGPRIDPINLLVKAMAIVFIAQFMVMLALPYLFSRIDNEYMALTDSSLTVLIIAPPIWWLFFRRELRNRLVPLADLWGTPLRLYNLLLFTIFLADLLQELLLPIIFPEIDRYSYKFVDAFLTTLMIAPILWWLVAQPLKQAAQSEKARAAAIHEQVLDAIVSINATGLIETVNPAAENMFGYSSDELYGKAAALLFHGDRHCLDELLNGATDDCDDSTTPHFYQEVLGQRKDDSSFVMDVSISKVILAGRQEFLLIMRDISTRTRMERELRESEVRFRSLSESAPVGVFHTDRAGFCLYTNRRWQNITGLTQEESLGRGWLVTVHPDDRDEVCAEWDKAIEAKAEFSREFRFLPTGGEERWVMAHAAPIFSQEGRTIGYVGTNEDITARKRGEQELQSSLSLLGTTLEATADGILAVDLTGKVRTYNQKFLDMWRLSPGDLESTSHFTLAKVADQLEDPDEYLHRLMEIFGSPEVTVLDSLRFRDGRVFERYTQPQIIEGTVVGRAWSYRDITARSKAEDLLRESEERFNMAVNGASDFIWDWNMSTGFLYYSPRLRELLGYAEDEVGQSFSVFESLLNPDDHDRVMETLQGHLEARTPFDTEYRLQSKAGRYLWFRSRGQAVWDDSGQAVRMAGSISDITARKETEDALRDSETRFRQIFEQSEDAIIFFKPGTCTIIDVNATAEKLYGFTKAELKERGLECLCMPENCSRMKSFVRTIRHGEPAEIDKMVNHRKDGTPLIVSLRGKVMSIQHVDVIYCTFREITERIRMEEEARSIQAKLIEANKMTSLGLLLSGVAHEINNPNTFILANSQLLSMAWNDALTILREYHRENGEFFIGGVPFSTMENHFPQLLAGINDGARRISDIINNLKTFTRQDRVAMERNVNLNKVVHSAVSLLHYEFVKHTEHFHLDLADGIPPVVGNRQQLSQVVINLLMNACQALTSKHQGIWLTTSYDKSSGTVTITVRDEGCGISKEQGLRIMDPFFTTKLDKGGTGLGLSICKSIVKDHNGSLEFTSEPGKGTVFTLNLPTEQKSNKEQS